MRACTLYLDSMSTAPRPLRIAMVIDVWDDAANGAVVSTRRFTELLRERGHTAPPRPAWPATTGSSGRWRGSSRSMPGWSPRIGERSRLRTGSV
jgi:hypothetical protein